MSEVSSDSKVISTSINKRFVRGTFFDEKYSPKEKKLFRKKVIK